MNLPTEEDLLDPLVRWNFFNWLEGENFAIWASCHTCLWKIIQRLEDFARNLPNPVLELQQQLQ